MIVHIERVGGGQKIYGLYIQSPIRATDEATGKELGRTMVDRKRQQEKAAKEETRVSFDVESQR